MFGWKSQVIAYVPADFGAVIVTLAPPLTVLWIFADFTVNVCATESSLVTVSVAPGATEAGTV